VVCENQGNTKIKTYSKTQGKRSTPPRITEERLKPEIRTTF